MMLVFDVVTQMTFSHRFVIAHVAVVSVPVHSQMFVLYMSLEDALRSGSIIAKIAREVSHLFMNWKRNLVTHPSTRWIADYLLKRGL